MLLPDFSLPFKFIHPVGEFKSNLPNGNAKTLCFFKYHENGIRSKRRDSLSDPNLGKVQHDLCP